MTTVNIDLDGVIYPWHEMFATYVASVRGRQFPVPFWWQYSNTDQYSPEPTTWNFWDEWGLTKDDFKLLFQGGVRDGVLWGEGRPLPGAQELMGKLSSEGFHVRIVTTRLYYNQTFGRVQQLTSRWLDDWSIPYREIVYLGQGSSKGDFRADFAIDDSINNVIEMRKTGTKAFLLERTWNAGHQASFAVKSLDDFYRKVKE